MINSAESADTDRSLHQGGFIPLAVDDGTSVQAYVIRPTGIAGPRT